MPIPQGCATRGVWDNSPSAVPCLTSSADGAVLAGGFTNGSVRVWDVGPKGLKERQPLDGRYTVVSALAFAPAGDELAIGGEDGAVHIWDLTKSTWEPRLKRLARTPAHAASGRAVAGNVAGVAFLPEGKSYAAAVSQHVEFWDRGPAKPKAISDSFDTPLSSLALSPDGATLVSGTLRGQLHFWDVADASGPHFLATFGGSAPAGNVAFSADGARLAVACQPANVVQVWRLPVEKLELEREIPAKSPLWTSFSPDGRTLAVAGQDSLVTFWDMTRSPPEKTDTIDLGQAQHFRSLDISPDGRWLAALRADAGGAFAYAVVLWDLAKKRKAQEWPWPGNIHHLRFAPDGRHLAVGNSNGTVYILRLSGKAH